MSDSLVMMNLKHNTAKKVDTVLRIYAITVFDTVITDKELEFLKAYIYSGYNDGTKKSLELNYSRGNINTTNASLQKKGFLKPKPYKQDKELHEKLEEIRRFFIQEDKKMLLLNFD